MLAFVDICVDICVIMLKSDPCLALMYSHADTRD
jgi:hypothetical protein